MYDVKLKIYRNITAEHEPVFISSQSKIDHKCRNLKKNFTTETTLKTFCEIDLSLKVEIKVLFILEPKIIQILP